ncbi:MAG TPA: AIR synthase-related protein, partial [Gemmatimonadales bacterium]|nr:AIR synthase-related protein [Gemmatimonadales bacterium]
RLGLDDTLGETGRSAADALLAVHRSYVAALRPVLGQVHALAHITGGGIAGNLVRVLPEGVEAVVDPASWPRPALFRFIQEAGRVAEDEMRDVFNLGLGMIAAVPAASVDAVRAAARAAGDETWVIGEVRAGSRAVRFAGRG